MTNTQPNVHPEAIYEAKAASEALGVSRQTLHRYTREGLCKSSVRRTNGRTCWTGAELIKLWRYVY